MCKQEKHDILHTSTNVYRRNVNEKNTRRLME